VGAARNLLVTAILASLGPFFLWALLKVLLGIYDEMRESRQPQGSAAPPLLPAAVSEAPARPARFSVRSLQQASRSPVNCPKCGMQWPLGSVYCVNCDNRTSKRTET
jgi:hypothetical protein